MNFLIEMGNYRSVFNVACATDFEIAKIPCIVHIDRVMGKTYDNLILLLLLLRINCIVSQLTRQFFKCDFQTQANIKLPGIIFFTFSAIIYFHHIPEFTIVRINLFHVRWNRIC